MKVVSSTKYALTYIFLKSQLWRWLLWFCVICLIFAASLLKYSPMHCLLTPPHDKVLHAVVFAGFLIFTQLLFKKLSLFKISLITLALGLLIELLQAYFTKGNRQFDAYDVLFNLLGIALGLLLLLVYRQGANGTKP